MHFKILALLTAMISISTALAGAGPTANGTEETGSLKTRNVAGVYACNGANWSGGCWWQQTSGGLCHGWGGANRGSFGPDYGINCQLFTGYQCNNKIEDVRHPGISDMNNVRINGIQFTPHSFRCEWIA